MLKSIYKKHVKRNFVKIVIQFVTVLCAAVVHLSLWYICHSGTSVTVAHLLLWHICHCGTPVTVVHLSRWYICHSGTSVTVVQLSQWYICHSGTSVMAAHLSQWHICHSSTSVAVAHLSHNPVCIHIYMHLTNGHKIQRSLCPWYKACHFWLSTYSNLPAVCTSNAPLLLSTGLSQVSTVLKLCRYTFMCICLYVHMCVCVCVCVFIYLFIVSLKHTVQYL
jgi:hypothetical protein